MTADGSDTHGGGQSDPLETISRAAELALDGYTIIVGPGVYREGVTTDRLGNPAQEITFIADVTGELTGDTPGAVVVDAAGSRVASAFRLSKSRGSIIEGFTLMGGSDAGIVLKSGSDDVQVRSCKLFGNPGDGIRVQDSARVVLFNNLIYRNAGRGIALVGDIVGSPDARVVSNTIFANDARGVTVGTTSAASARAFLRNNIVQENGGTESIKIFKNPRSDLGYDGDFNIVLPAVYDPSTLNGRSDINQDARFVDPAPTEPDLHLRTDSPAIDHGDAVGTTLRGCLQKWSVTASGNPDNRVLDIGYHFPIHDPHCGVIIPTPSPTP